MSNLRSIQPSITKIEDKIYQVKVLNGAAEILCAQKTLIGKYCKKRSTGYQTNPEIKYWSSFFLLKAISPNSSVIENHRQQIDFICRFIGISKRTLSAHLFWLRKMKLATIDKNITLVSWDTAAHILDIPYSGTILLPYNPLKNEGKQDFQYQLRTVEIEANQQMQLDGLMTKLDHNPSLKNDLVYHLVQQGADQQRLFKDRAYFQQRLIQLLIWFFKKGSEFLQRLFSNRVDINRGIATMASHHNYKSKQSVCYLKRVLFKLGLVQVKKIQVISEARSRLYYQDKEGKQHDAFKWFNNQKQTSLTLTDQIIINYEIQKPGKRKTLQNAA